MRLLLLLSIAIGIGRSQCTGKNQVCLNYQGVDIYDVDGVVGTEFEPEPRQFQMHANIARMDVKRVDSRLLTVEANLSLVFDIEHLNYPPAIAAFTTEERRAQMKFIFAKIPKFLGCLRTTVSAVENYDQNTVSVEGRTRAHANLTIITQCDNRIGEVPTLDCTTCLSVQRATALMLYMNNFTYGKIPDDWILTGMVKTISTPASNGELDNGQALLKFTVQNPNPDALSESAGVLFIMKMDTVSITVLLVLVVQFFCENKWRPAVAGVLVLIYSTASTKEDELDSRSEYLLGATAVMFAGPIADWFTSRR